MGGEPVNTNSDHTNGDKVESKNGEEKPNKATKEETEKVESKTTDKFLTNEKMAAYSLYSACFQNELYFEDYHIYHKWLKISREDWRKIVKEMNSLLAQKIDFIPVEKTWHYTLRVCKKRKVPFEEEKAMK